MDIDVPTSSAGRRSSLPPSSAPGPSTHGGTPRRPVENGRQNGGADALALDGFDQEDNAQVEEGTGRRQRRRAGGRLEGDVPLVRDALGEQITESFQNFLET